MPGLLLSNKYKAFIKCKALVEFLEGTTYAGKTTVGIYKFMLKVADSDKKLHIIAAKDTGTAEKNIIDKELGVLDDFGILVSYNGNGTKDNKIPHIYFITSKGDKLIYVMGYGDKQKWQKALGGQYGCLYIDEINTADIDFVREAAMRCDYMLATLNPDDPNLPIYKEYVNCSRPLSEWIDKTPKEILAELKEEPKPEWVHWFFSFEDNLGLSKEKLNIIFTNTPKGTKIWKNKIQGLRGKAAGLVFPNFDRKKHVLTESSIKTLEFIKYSAGLDTAYSSKSPDTIAMIFQGVTKDRRLIILSERIYNNADLSAPLAPSDTVKEFIDFLDDCKDKYGLCRNTFIDCADQATLTELKKYKRINGSVYIFNDAYKSIKIIDRINLMLGWIQQGKYLVSEDCKEHLNELENYSWKEDKDEPEDRNDHTINASQYAWIPYKSLIGFEEKEVPEEWD
jgi:PBSX family phage terminase large subunit